MSKEVDKLYVSVREQMSKLQSQLASKPDVEQLTKVIEEMYSLQYQYHEMVSTENAYSEYLARETGDYLDH